MKDIDRNLLTELNLNEVKL